MDLLSLTPPWNGRGTVRTVPVEVKTSAPTLLLRVGPAEVTSPESERLVTLFLLLKLPQEPNVSRPLLIPDMLPLLTWLQHAPWTEKTPPAQLLCER